MPKKKVKIEGIPVYQKGGKTTPAPIYVSDPKDTRLQAYNDSLKLYNSYQELKNKLAQSKYVQVPINEFYRLSEAQVIKEALRDKSKDTWADKHIDNPFANEKEKKRPWIEASKDGNLYKTLDFYDGEINKDLGYQYFSTTIRPKSQEKWRKHRHIGDGRLVYNYENVNPQQVVILNKIPNEVIPIIKQTDKNFYPIKNKKQQINQLPIYKGVIPTNSKQTDIQETIVPPFTPKLPSDYSITMRNVNPNLKDYSEEQVEFKTPQEQESYIRDNKLHRLSTGMYEDVKKYQKGGKTTPAPIYIDNVNDPRYRAYQDSLGLYNRGVEDNKFFREHSNNTPIRKFPFSKVTSHSVNANVIGKIKPISAYTWDNISSDHPDYYRAHWFGYKKPEQQVILGQKINRLPVDTESSLYIPQQTRIPQYTSKIPNEWYSNKQRVPIDADNVDALYNEDGTRKYQNGGKTKAAPIYVDNINDPRYRAYQDSLSLYNKGKSLLEEYWDTKYTNKEYEEGVRSNASLEGFYGDASMKKYINDKIKPVGFLTKGDVPVYKRPLQPVKVGYEINRLSIDKTEPYQPQQTQIPQYTLKIPNEWYSNKQRVPIDADNVDALYNEDGTRKYQNGGHTMKRKVTIVEIPKMANGGWAAQVHGGLNLPYPMSFNAKQQRVSDPEFNMKKSLSPVPREQSDIEAEKGEHILGDFDGDGAPESMAVGGKRHSAGGTPLSVPDNSFVFSDTQRLKIKDPNILSVFDASKPQTPGKLAKKYPLNDFKSMMEDPKTDPLSRKTAEMMYGNNMKKLQQLAEAQEMIKASKGIPASPQHMATGGPSGANMGNSFRFDLPVAYEQMANTSQKPEAVAMANILYGPSATGTFTDNINGPRTQFVRQWQTPTPNNLQQGSQIDNLGTTPPQQMPVGQPYAPQMTNIPSSLMPGTVDKGTGRGDKRKVRIEGLSADTVEDMALGLKALNTKKYTPWEPAVQVVKPSLLLESDQPIRNVLAENANTISNAMYSGNSRIGRAAAQGAMGELLKSSIGAAGEVSNRNQQAGNRYNELLANLENTRLMQERERGKRLYDGNTIADQQYRNSLNALGQQFADNVRQREEKAAYREWQNKTSPYFMTDKRGRPVFKSDNAEKQFYIDQKEIDRGKGVGNDITLESLKNSYIAKQYSPEKAQELAEKDLHDMMRKQWGLTSSTTVTEKTPLGSKKTKSKYGGLLASRRL